MGKAVIPAQLGVIRTDLFRVSRTTLAALAVATCLTGLSGCTTQLTKHGHQFRATDLQRLQPGMSQDEVKLALGTPTTTSTVNEGAAYYYISSTKKQSPFLSAKEVDRKVLAVYFTPLGTVDRMADYGIKDGRVFDYISGTTPTASKNEDGIFQSLFRNLGKRGSIFGE